jgi:hypothetical protein
MALLNKVSTSVEFIIIDDDDELKDDSAKAESKIERETADKNIVIITI